MPFHQRRAPAKTSSGKKMGRPRRIEEAVSWRRVTVRMTEDEFGRSDGRRVAHGYKDLSEMVRALMELRPPRPRVEIREVPARVDQEAVLLLRRATGLMKLLLGIERSMADTGAVPGLTREQQEQRWSQLIAMNKSVHQLLERLA